MSDLLKDIEEEYNRITKDNSCFYCSSKESTTLKTIPLNDKDGFCSRVSCCWTCNDCSKKMVDNE